MNIEKNVNSVKIKIGLSYLFNAALIFIKPFCYMKGMEALANSTGWMLPVIHYWGWFFISLAFDFAVMSVGHLFHR